MVVYFYSILPILIGCICSILFTWLICKYWYSSRYIPTNEVRPLQEAQYIMQNQYALLCERIKNTEKKLLETTEKLELESVAHIESIKKIDSLENKVNPKDHNTQGKVVGMEIKEELQALLDLQQKKNISTEELDKLKLNELITLMRQNLQEFNIDFNQKFRGSTSQQNELSNQIWLLLEVNKKLSEETSQLNRTLNNNIFSTEKNQERPFTLAQLQKRS